MEASGTPLVSPSFSLLCKIIRPHSVPMYDASLLKSKMESPA